MGAKGIEPLSQALEARILPLNYAPLHVLKKLILKRYGLSKEILTNYYFASNFISSISPSVIEHP